jgi:hypothetical protein
MVRRIRAAFLSHKRKQLVNNVAFAKVKHLPELGEDQLGLPHFLLASEAVSSDQTKPKQQKTGEMGVRCGGEGNAPLFVDFELVPL